MNDLLEIARFIGADDPCAARAWVEKLRRTAYRVEPHGLLVLTVFEGHRLLPTSGSL